MSWLINMVCLSRQCIVNTIVQAYMSPRHAPIPEARAAEEAAAAAAVGIAAALRRGEDEIMRSGS
jgi:hypothetical protein